MRRPRPDSTGGGIRIGIVLTASALPLSAPVEPTEENAGGDADKKDDEAL